MSMRKFAAVTVVVLVAGAYAAGYWPQHQRLVSLQSQLRDTQEQLAVADTRVRVSGLLGLLLAVVDVTASRNYGQAQTLSSDFFDQLSAESARTQPPPLQDTLNAILRMRDQVTAGLTRADPAVLGLLRQAQIQMRKALGYPVIAEPVVEEPIVTETTGAAQPPAP